MSKGDLYRRAYSSINYRLRSFAGGRFASACRPVSIIFLLTERCNAKCVHCDIWKNKGKEDSPTPEQWKQVLKDLRAWLGPVHIVFSGGEALLKPFAAEIASYASGLGFWVEVLTHGYWTDTAKLTALATAGPSRLTISFDGLGATHSKIRGREDFFEKTSATIQLFRQLRQEKQLRYTVRLKTVIMSHNLHDIAAIAEFATQDGMEVFYQAIEQNYNTPEDPLWYQSTSNWPTDTAKAVAVVEKLLELKKKGLHIANTDAQLEAMIPYFQNPSGCITEQFHMAHEKRPLCSALTTLQLQANGDVTVCFKRAPVGNIKERGIRSIWEERPRVWEMDHFPGCCTVALPMERGPEVQIENQTV